MVLIMTFVIWISFLKLQLLGTQKKSSKADGGKDDNKEGGLLQTEWMDIERSNVESNKFIIISSSINNNDDK